MGTRGGARGGEREGEREEEREEAPAPVSGVRTGVLASAVHGCHPGALLAGGRLLQGQVDDVDQSELLVVPQHVGIDVVVDAHVLCRQDRGNRLSVRPTGRTRSDGDGDAT